MNLNKSIKIFIILFLSLLGCALIMQPILAQQGSTGKYEIPNPINTDSFEGLVKKIAEWFYKIMVPLAAIMVLYAGFLFLTSGGDEEKIKKAKKAITYTIVGVAIIVIGAGFITLIKSILEVN